MVTDGLVRDLAGIRPLGLPVFGAGLSPNSPFCTGPAKIGFPVVMGGRPVATGDIVLGDEDGVVIVPFEKIDATIEALDQIASSEKALGALVEDGLIVTDKIKAILASAQTKYL